MTVPNNALLRISARMRHGSFGDVVNVWNAICDFATPQAESVVFAACDAWMTTIYQEIDQLISSIQEPLDLKVDVVTHIAGKWEVVANVGFGSWGAAIVTAETQDLLPSGVAMLGKLRTGLGKHWGRKWLGVFTEVSNVAGFVSTALQTAGLASLGQFLLGHVIVSGNGMLPILLQSNGIYRDITEVAVNSVWSYMRTRRTGVGS